MASGQRRGQPGQRGQSTSRGRPPARDTAPGPRNRDARGLSEHLTALDGGSYGRYKSLNGSWEFDSFTLHVRKVQPDPYAPASRCQIRVPAEVAAFDPDLHATPTRARGLCGYLLRALHRELRDSLLRVDAGGQQVLDRSACQIDDGDIVVGVGIDLPGRGRTIAGRQADKALCVDLPRAVEAALRAATADVERVRAFVDSIEDTTALRETLAERDWVAFVADGAILARRSGIDDRPLLDAVPFRAPESLSAEVDLPHRGRVRGMAVPTGVTLVVGGGFHGKSTLLRALELGVYDHVAGDGRELVVSRPDTVKIRAEDGRRVHRVDVSPFVSHLPTGADTTDFSTDNASGSTSQAAAIVEAIEAGAGVLLLDEDTAATNLMIRDARMQELVAKESEPLTPFVDLIAPLHAAHGVSTVLVMGGSGDYMDVADRVVMMDAYHPRDVTDRARQLAARPTGQATEAAAFPQVRHRIPHPKSVGGDRPKVRARGVDALTLGESTVELRGVEQLVDPSQVTGIGLALVELVRSGAIDGHRSLAEVLAVFAERVADEGVAAVDARFLGDFAVPRPFELAAAFNRLRTLAARPVDEPT